MNVLNLIWGDYIEFLKNKGIYIDIAEGYFWLDRQIIKAYDCNGELHNLYRLKVDGKEITCKKYNTTNFKVESWQDTLARKNEHLFHLETKSKDVLSVAAGGRNVAVMVSGGKDSAVVHHLASSVFSDFQTIFNNTSNETHHTYKYIKQNYPGIIILSPERGLYSLVKEYGSIPSRFNRFCCSYLKENVLINQLGSEDNFLFVMGMRKSESSNRSTYTYEWRNEKWRNNTWQGVLPILDYTDEDIWLTMLKYNIPVNQMYKFGFSRVGCVHCPYRTDHELLLTEYFLPSYAKRWHKILTDDFIEHGKATAINCSLQEYVGGAWRGGMVRDEATEEIKREFMEYKNIADYEIVEKYFDKVCSDCDKKIKKDNVALSLKYFGRQSTKLFCIKCLGNRLERSGAELRQDIRRFKDEGCSLF